MRAGTTRKTRTPEKGRVILSGISHLLFEFYLDRDVSSAVWTFLDRLGDLYFVTKEITYLAAYHVSDLLQRFDRRVSAEVLRESNPCYTHFFCYLFNSEAFLFDSCFNVHLLYYIMYDYNFACKDNQLVCFVQI